MSPGSRPPSPLQPNELHYTQLNMAETRRPLPPPTFLGREESGYATFRPHLPNLTHYSPYESAHPPLPPPPHQQQSLPPMHQQHQLSYRHGQELPSLRATTSITPTASSSGTRPYTRAIPVTSLLSDEPPKPSRSDSLVPPPPASAPLPSATPSHQSLQNLPHVARPEMQPVRYPYQPYSPDYSMPAPVAQHRHVPPRPIFTSPFATPVHGQEQRRVSSTGSPTASSVHSQHVMGFEPRSAISETSPGHESFARPSQPEPEPEPPEFEYSLRMRQQPIAARACGFGERDRRVVDPPPIVELIARDPVTGKQEYESDSYVTLHCVLVDPDTGEDQSQIPPSRPDMASAQRLMGNSLASPCVAKDEKGVKGSFFVFPDLSCRSPGKYKLLFRLLKVNPRDMTNPAKNRIRATLHSDAFDVFTAKEFPGMRASSALLRSLRNQGLNVGVKKGSAASRRNARRKALDQQQRRRGHHSDGEEDDDDDDDDDSEDNSDSEDEEDDRPRKKGQKRDKEEEAQSGTKDKGKGKAKKPKGH
ncbi:hypothetical protein MBLNU457_6329t1 [Dothideomycetes sp. NU457]